MSTGLPLLVALIEFGVIVWLWLSRRDARREITNLTLRARKAELRVPDDHDFWVGIRDDDHDRLVRLMPDEWPDRTKETK